MPSYISDAEAADIRGEFRNLEDTIRPIFWDVTWTAWKTDRPVGTWDNGTASETWEKVGTGDGRLSGGKGGPMVGGELIYQRDPYELRHLVSDNLAPNMLIVIDGRSFRVDSVADRAGERQHATAYLTELFGVTPPEDPGDEEPPDEEESEP